MMNQNTADQNLKNLISMKISRAKGFIISDSRNLYILIFVKKMSHFTGFTGELLKILYKRLILYNISISVFCIKFILII